MTTTHKSARKKQNRFEELGEAVEEHKDSDIIDPTSSITCDHGSITIWWKHGRSIIQQKYWRQWWWSSPLSLIPFGSTNNHVDTTTPARDNTTVPRHIHGSGPITNLHKFWKVVSDDNLEPHRFQTLIKDITLHDDSLQAFCHFYNRICHVMHRSFKKHVDILPPIGKLGQVHDITSLLVP